MYCRTKESSKGEGKRLLRTLELKAFRNVVDALRAQGSFTSRKCSMLKNLAATLKVGDERCRSEMRRAVNDNVLNYIAESSGEPNSEEKWRLESARKVARVPMVNEPTVFTTLADKVSDWVSSQKQNVEKDCTLIDIIESKKCRTDANASRYHSSKLLKPLLINSSRDAAEIAIELEKIKYQSRLLSNKIHPMKEDTSSVTKPVEIVFSAPVEIPKISSTPVENTRSKESLVVESNNVTINSCSKDAIEIPNNVSTKNNLPSKNNVPTKSRPATSRSRSRPKRSQPAKRNFLQEELSRTVSAMNALVTPASEQNDAERPADDSLNSVADGWQPKGKKSRISTPVNDSLNSITDEKQPKGKNSKISAPVDDSSNSVADEWPPKGKKSRISTPVDDSSSSVADEWQPKGKKSRISTSKKVPSDEVDKNASDVRLDAAESIIVLGSWDTNVPTCSTHPAKKVPSDEVSKNTSIVRIDKLKSTIVLGSWDNNLSTCSTHPVDDSMADASQETVSVSQISSVKSTPENPSVSEQDFMPHTFNLIPASRRLKLVKKKENSNEFILLKEQELVVPANSREMQNAQLLMTKESNLPEKNKSVDPRKAAGILQKNVSVSSSTVRKTGDIATMEHPLQRRKETDEKLKNVPPVLSQTKKTLSVLGNIKVRNLNAKPEDESPKDSLPSSTNLENAEVKIEIEEELGESDFESDFTNDSYASDGFGDSDSHSVIEYWDHEDDDGILENGGNLDCGNEEFEKINSVKKISDDVLRSDLGVVSDEISDSEYEEIVADEEFFYDGVDSSESENSDELLFDFKYGTSSSSSDEDFETRIQPIVSTKKPGIRTLLPKNRASNASVLHSSPLVSTPSAANTSNSQKNDTKMETSSLTKIGPSVSGAAISILKLRKPLAVGTAAEQPKPKEVVVPPLVQKPVVISVPNEKTASSLPRYQTIPPSQCVVRGQTISLANARLIKAAPKTSQPITGGKTMDLPKITVHPPAKMPTSTGVQHTIPSKRFILPANAKSSSTGSVKQTTFKETTIPKKVCRLYDLMDASAAGLSNSSSNNNAKKKCLK